MTDKEKELRSIFEDMYRKESESDNECLFAKKDSGVYKYNIMEAGFLGFMAGILVVKNL